MNHHEHHEHNEHHDPLPNDVNATATRVLDAAFAVHRYFGPGLLENVYEACLTYKLRQFGLTVDRQCWVPVVFEELRLSAGVRLDLMVESRVVVELKAVERLTDVHRAQVITYLKLTGLRLGLLLNFNVSRLRDGIQRIIR